MNEVPTNYLFALVKDLLGGGFPRLFRSQLPHSCHLPLFPPRFPPDGSFSPEHARALLSLTCYLTSQGCAEEIPEDRKRGFDVTPLLRSEETAYLPGRGARTYARLNCRQQRECLGLFCYSQREDLALIIFTGTSSLCQWLDDFDYVQCPVSEVIEAGQGLAHWGFLRSYASLRGQIQQLLESRWSPSTQVAISGISLGGALATLCAYDLADFSPHLYTFAAPSVFDPAGAGDFDQKVSSSHRVANGCDLIPSLPLPVMTAPYSEPLLYVQTKGLFLFHSNLGNYVDNHTLAYLRQFGLGG